MLRFKVGEVAIIDVKKHNGKACVIISILPTNPEIMGHYEIHVLGHQSSHFTGNYNCWDHQLRKRNKIELLEGGWDNEEMKNIFIPKELKA